MILDIVAKDTPILHTKLEPFDFANPSTDPIQLAKDLTETMLANNGMGLAANQCGLPYRCFVMKSNPIVAVFNPRIIDQSSEEIYLDEGCLSYKLLYISVKRCKSIKVRYEMPNGETVTHTYTGMTARIFQHETDHTNGITFNQRANHIHLERARNRMKKELRRLKKTNGASNLSEGKT